MIPRRIAFENIFSFYIFLVIFGYQFFAVFFELFGSELVNTIGTYFYRGLTLLVGTFLFLLNFRLNVKRKSIQEGFIYLFFIFWTFFFIRFIYDGLTGKLDTFIINFYGLNSIFFTFIPALFLFRNINSLMIKNFAMISFWALLFVVAFTPLVFYSNIEESVLTGSRVSLERLSPIIYGRSCAFLFFISIFLFNMNKINLVSLFIVCLISVVGIFTSGSRGAILSFALILILVSLFNIYKTLDIKQFIFICIILVFGIFLSITLTSYFVPELNLINNLFVTGSFQDKSAQMRYEYYDGALNQFYQNPLFGDLIIEKRGGLYPHNIFLETFMAMGMVGGLTLLSIIFLVVFKFFRTLKNKETSQYFIFLYTLFGIIFLAHQFSYSIFHSSEFWSIIILCIFYKHNSNFDSKSSKKIA